MRKKLIATTVIISYFLFDLLVALPFYLLNVDPTILPNSVKTFYLIDVNLIFLCGILIIYNKEFAKFIKDFKINGKKYLKQSIKYWIIGVIVMLVSNSIIGLLFSNAIPENEEAVRSLIKAMPVYMIFTSIIFAPIVEEIICRKILKDFIKNKWLFIISSAFCFASLHVIFNLTSTWNLLYIIPYGALGFAFAYAYHKTNNLLVPIILHFIHNALLIILYIIIL